MRRFAVSWLFLLFLTVSADQGVSTLSRRLASQQLDDAPVSLLELQSQSTAGTTRSVTFDVFGVTLTAAAPTDPASIVSLCLSVLTILTSMLNYWLNSKYLKELKEKYETLGGDYETQMNLLITQVDTGVNKLRVFIAKAQSVAGVTARVVSDAKLNGGGCVNPFHLHTRMHCLLLISMMNALAASAVGSEETELSFQVYESNIKELQQQFELLKQETARTKFRRKFMDLVLALKDFITDKLKDYSLNLVLTFIKAVSTTIVNAIVSSLTGYGMLKQTFALYKQVRRALAFEGAANAIKADVEAMRARMEQNTNYALCKLKRRLVTMTQNLSRLVDRLSANLKFGSTIISDMFSTPLTEFRIAATDIENLFVDPSNEKQDVCTSFSTTEAIAAQDQELVAPLQSGGFAECRFINNEKSYVCSVRRGELILTCRKMLKSNSWQMVRRTFKSYTSGTSSESQFELQQYSIQPDIVKQCDREQLVFLRSGMGWLELKLKTLRFEDPDCAAHFCEQISTSYGGRPGSEADTDQMRALLNIRTLDQPVVPDAAELPGETLERFFATHERGLPNRLVLKDDNRVFDEFGVSTRLTTDDSTFTSNSRAHVLSAEYETRSNEQMQLLYFLSEDPDLDERGGRFVTDLVQRPYSDGDDVYYSGQTMFGTHVFTPFGLSDIVRTAPTDKYPNGLGANFIIPIDSRKISLPDLDTALTNAREAAHQRLLESQIAELEKKIEETRNSSILSKEEIEAAVAELEESLEILRDELSEVKELVDADIARAQQTFNDHSLPKKERERAYKAYRDLTASTEVQATARALYLLELRNLGAPICDVRLCNTLQDPPPGYIRPLVWASAEVNNPVLGRTNNLPLQLCYKRSLYLPPVPSTVIEETAAVAADTLKALMEIPPPLDLKGWYLRNTDYIEQWQGICSNFMSYRTALYLLQIRTQYNKVAEVLDRIDYPADVANGKMRLRFAFASTVLRELARRAVFFLSIFPYRLSACYHMDSTTGEIFDERLAYKYLIQYNVLKLLDPAWPLDDSARADRAITAEYNDDPPEAPDHVRDFDSTKMSIREIGEQLGGVWKRELLSSKPDLLAMDRILQQNAVPLLMRDKKQAHEPLTLLFSKLKADNKYHLKLAREWVEEELGREVPFWQQAYNSLDFYLFEDPKNVVSFRTPETSLSVFRGRFDALVQFRGEEDPAGVLLKSYVTKVQSPAKVLIEKSSPPPPKVEKSWFENLVSPFSGSEQSSPKENSKGREEVPSNRFDRPNYDKLDADDEGDLLLFFYTKVRDEDLKATLRKLFIKQFDGHFHRCAYMRMVMDQWHSDEAITEAFEHACPQIYEV